MMNGTAPAAREPVKLAVCIASRGRPSALCGVIMAAHRLQSGTNLIAFVVAVDEDDEPSQRMLGTIGADGEVNLVPVIGPRPPYMGAAQNRAIAAAGDADIVMLLSDRTFIITPGYDYGIVEAAMKYPNRVLWLSCPHDPDTTVPIIPHTILDAVGWKWSPEIWPFWFDDTWWAEVDRMVFGGPSLRVKPAFAGLRAQTTRGREFELWTRLWIATRPRRIEAAKAIAEKLGVPWQDPPADMLEDFYARDRHLLANATRFEDALGDKRDPGPEYFEARAKAEAILKEMGA